MVSDRKEQKKQQKADELEEIATEAGNLAEKLGLEPFDVDYWIVDYDEINVVAAYGGFQERYPHWRWGMQYDLQKKKSDHGLGKLYELVVDDEPAQAYLQEANDRASDKLVITHVEGHSDFFANNQWYHLFREGGPDSAGMLADHAEKIEAYMKDPDIEREDVERWIDHILTIEYQIDQYQPFQEVTDEEIEREEDEDVKKLKSMINDLDLPDHIKEERFDDEWIEDHRDQVDTPGKSIPQEPEKDLLGFIIKHGKAYDKEEEKAVEMEDWQEDVLQMLRKESYYFAPHLMTKVMNEGWAAYYHQKMMVSEGFADENEIIDFADHDSRVVSGGDLENPYFLGRHLWEYIENKTNRRDVVSNLLQVDGITADSFHDQIDFDQIYNQLQADEALTQINSDTLDQLQERDSSKFDEESIGKALEGEIDIDKYPWKVLSFEGLAERHYSLNQPENHGFIEQIAGDKLDEIERYLSDTERYGSIEEAVEDVDYTAGWEKMLDIRESHNDITFIDEYFTDEFLDTLPGDRQYATYELLESEDQYQRVLTSLDADDIKKKLLLKRSNMGQPNIKVHDDNYNNSGELLLGHHYNGVPLDFGKALETMKRIHKLWGRPVNLKTVTKEKHLDSEGQAIQNIWWGVQRGDKNPQINIKEPDKQGLMLRYDEDEGAEGSALEWAEVEDLVEDDIDYNTIPDEWLYSL
jgi:stage V sporulation protein R